MLNIKAPETVADINVTPLVDVMLVLLIIFMVITPMLQHGVQVDMVKTKNPIPMQDADKSDARAKYGDVVKAVDAIRAAGVDSLGLLTERLQRAGGAPTITP